MNLLIPLLLSLSIQEPTPARAPRTSTELAQFESAYQDLLAEYNRVWKAWIDASNAARAAKQKSPGPDPTPTFVPRFRQLLANGLDHAAVWVLANDTKVSAQENLDLFERLVHEHSDASWAAEIGELGPAVYFTLDVPRLVRICDEFVERRHADAVAARLLFGVASNLKEIVVVDGPETHHEQALAYFRRYLELWPAGADAEEARRAVYALENLRIGKPAPEITGKDVDGHELRLSALRGKVVVVDFWATWCAPCRRALPHLKELLQRHPTDLAILGIANDDDPEEFRRLLRELDVVWPNVFEGSAAGAITSAWGVTGLPTTFVLDRAGVIRSRVLPDDLDALVEQLIAEKTSAGR